MIQDLSFYIFSIVTLVSAFLVVTMRNPVHSVLFLILAFFSSAGFFILLGAEFLALILVIVYVGAVAVLFMFVVMMLDIPVPTMKRWFVPKVKDFVHSIVVFGGYSVVFLTVFYLSTVIFSFVMESVLGYYTIDSSSFILTPFSEAVRVIKTAPQYGVWGMIWLFVLFVGSFLVARGVAQKTVKDSFIGSLNQLLLQSPLGLILIALLGTVLYVVIAKWGELAVAQDTALLPMQPASVLPNTNVLGQVIYTDYLYIFQAAGLILLVAMIGAIVLTMRRRVGVKAQSISEQINRRPEEEIELKKLPLGKGLS